MSRVTYGQARVEYLALCTEIHEELARGYTLKTIYAKLKEQSRITASYSHMAALIKYGLSPKKSVYKQEQKVGQQTSSRHKIKIKDSKLPTDVSLNSLIE